MVLAKARDWQSLVDGFSPVMKLVHLAMRMTEDDVQRFRGEWLRQRRQAYEDELTLQAGRVGCPGRRGRLTEGESLSQLNDAALRDAQSVVNTYNYDLAVAIMHIRAEMPTANRHVYARRLADWDEKRAAWKDQQITEHNTGEARALAQQDFYRFNSAFGYAVLRPEEAVCPVCIGWVARGEVPLHEAQNEPPPYHVGCPHYWRTYPDRVAPSECPNLWMGG